MKDAVCSSEIYKSAPVYSRLSQKIKIPFLLASILVGVVVLALLEFGRWWLGVDFDGNAFFTLSLCLAMVAIGLALLNQAYVKICSTVLDIQELLEDEDSIKKMTDEVSAMFSGRWSFLFSTFMSVLFIFILYWLGIGYHNVYSSYIYLFGGMGFFVAGAGLFIAYRSLIFLHNYFGSDDLKLYVLPNRTYALVKISRLYASLALSFSLEIVIFVVAFYITEWTNVIAHQISSLAIVTPFVLFTLFYISYPQYKIHNVVRGRKEVLLKNIEKSIAWDQCFIDGDVPNLQKINELIDVHEKISNSSDNMLSFGVAGKFIAAILLPVGAYMFEEQPAFLAKITLFIFGG